jgi:glycosyltransferase involved in cell wall biosynthesis
VIFKLTIYINNKFMKNLLIFMPSIEGGGVEKNLFIISNFLAKKIPNTFVLTASKKFKHKFKKNIGFLTTKKNFWDNCGRRIKFLACLTILFFFLIRNRNTLVLCFQANVYCTILCKFLNIKIIVRSNSAPSGWSQNIIKKFIFNKILKFANLIIVNSYEFKKELKKRLDLDSTCIYNPLNKYEIIKLSKHKIKNNFFNKKSLNIINVGRFADQKDQICLLKAINLIKNKIDIKLILIGKGDHKNIIVEYINKNSLKNIVLLKNFSENPFPFIKSSDLFILTSKYEGLPNVLLETIALKKMVISSDCPTGPKEILDNGKGGLLFKVGNHTELANKIQLYFHNKKKIKKKIQYAYKRLDRFESNLNLKKYLYFVKKIMNI